MKKEGIIIISSIIGINVAIIILFALTPFSDPFAFFIRLCALLGMVAMFISSMLTPFQKELYEIFKKPFVKIHHTSTITGLTLITAHPVIFAINKAILTTAREGAKVFLPDFSTWYNFWSLAGRPAIYIIYIALVGALIRKAFKAGWRWIHSLNYIALAFGVVHGIMIGTDFYGFAGPIGIQIPNLIMTILFLLMLVLTLTTFTIKRYQIIKRQRKKAISKETAQKDEEKLVGDE